MWSGISNGLARFFLFMNIVCCYVFFYCLSHYCAQISRAKIPRQEPGYEFKNSWDWWWKRDDNDDMMMTMATASGNDDDMLAYYRASFIHSFFMIRFMESEKGRESRSIQTVLDNNWRFNWWYFKRLYIFYIYLRWYMLCMIAHQICTLSHSIKICFICFKLYTDKAHTIARTK